MRVSPVVPRANVLAVVGRVHAAQVRAQLPGLVPGSVLVEPQARNTAAAIALAALHVARRDPEAVMAVLPADHVIPDRVAFRADLRLALDLAEAHDALVTLGVPPTRPETGYGYIRPAAALAGTRGRAAWVARFVEKPDEIRARLLIRQGCLWNAGIFAWRARVILAALRRHLPAVLEPIEAAMRAGSAAALARAYRRVPSVSIDTGVLERADRVLAVRARFRWSDVGSWAALAEVWGTGRDGNATRGRVVAVDSQRCLVDAGERMVAILGVEDLVVVDTPDAVLVCRKDRAQDVRRVVDELGRRRLGRYR